MFEYTHTGFLFIGGFLIFFIIFTQVLRSGKAQHEGKKIGFPYLMFMAIAIIVTIVLSDTYERKERITNNFKLFKSNQTLRCSTLTTTYLVLKEKGWTLLDKRTLSNGEILLNVDFCKGSDDV